MFANLQTVWYRRRQWLAGAVAVITVLIAGCDDTEESLRRFRDAATQSVQDGTKAVLGGLVDGFFAAVVPPNDSESGTDTVEEGGGV